MAKKNAKQVHAVSAMEDVRRAQDALMEVNHSLQAAISACRALVHDARMIKDPVLSKAARKLHATVKAMKDGPNVAVWAPLKEIEQTANAVYSANESSDA